MIAMTIIYRVNEEGMIVEELDDAEEMDRSIQGLPIYSFENRPIESSVPIQ